MRGTGAEAVVGWDNPMPTFFARVRRRGRAVPGVGGAPGEVERAEDLAAPLAPWAELTPAHVALLRADLAANADAGPTAAQRSLLGVARRAARGGDTGGG